MRGSVSPNRKAAVVVAMIAILVIVDLVIIGMVISEARDHDLTVKRMQTMEAFYAAEAGMNMAIREMMVGVDEDADDPGSEAGSISADGDELNDPAFGNAQSAVTRGSAGGNTTLTSQGRSGEARREMLAELQ
jgi:hypothetical protein